MATPQASSKSPRKSSSFLSLRREKEPRNKSRPSTSAGISSSNFDFPSLDPQERKPTPSRSSRSRSTTGLSTKSNQETVPGLRFSNSSNTETPPRTPDDFNPSIESLHFPIVVGAPVAGVETMDALVDGMNGGDVLTPRHTTSRNRFGIPGHHPLYQPPLPTPPPGVVLGGGKIRKPPRKSSHHSDSSEDETYQLVATRRKKKTRPVRAGSSSTVVAPSTPPRIFEHVAHPSPARSSLEDGPTPAPTPRKSVVPSISEIIRNHTIPEPSRSRPSTIRSSSLYTPSVHGHATLHEEAESEPEPLTREEEAELMSRSSIDSVADEVQRTIRKQGLAPRPTPPPPPPSYFKRHSVISDNTSLYSPRSDPGAPSLYSVSAPSSYAPSSPFEPSFLSMTKPSGSQAVAQYLRSARLTTLLKLTRSPHASADNPLTVSLSDLGSPHGHPVVVFLGLGCVRHIMGLYDEMAECLNLRLITIDRWGLGRTEPRSKSAKGIMQWASVVEEVLDILRIGQCSVMAHSAGAPYALSFANKVPRRIHGEVCLLAPWVGGSDTNGYKWLKYVPNGLLKTAQAAEWKIQAWMIGKPPTIAYEGIGYNAPPRESKSSSRAPSPRSNGKGPVYPSQEDVRSRPSNGSSSFSEYDDLQDFDGRFESRDTLGLTKASTQVSHDGTTIFVNRRKTSRGILDILKGSSAPAPLPQEKQALSTSKRLKGLRSMGSLKGKKEAKAQPSSPQLPPALRIDVGLGLEEVPWGHRLESDTASSSLTATPQMHTINISPRANGRRSVSFTSSKAPTSYPSSPSPSAFTTSFGQQESLSNHGHQVALGNALIAASHAESAKGTHNDLLQILNHEGHSWGFSYASYPHKVRIWYGDKDEKIAENAVRWMERTMGPETCSVKVVTGADHGLMYRSSVVVDVFERIAHEWRADQSRPFDGIL